MLRYMAVILATAFVVHQWESAKERDMKVCQNCGSTNIATLLPNP
jgi:hypothetical protein